MRKRRIVEAVLAATVLAGVAGAAEAYDKKSDRVARGLEIAPVPLDLKGKKERVVGLGSYLVNALGGCSDCHTAPSYLPGGDPHAGEPEKINTAGYLGGGAQFGPTLVWPNLTPDANGLPGGMTWKQFKRAMRFGQDPDDPTRILQVMPWPVYSKMTDSDLYAIYVYLKAIPSVESALPPAPEPDKKS